MKILLVAINTKYIHSNLAIYTLKANAGEHKDLVELAEYTINNQMDDILADIYRRKAQVVCFSCYIWNIEYVEATAKEFRKLCPDTPVWVGGPEVSYETDSFLRSHDYISGVMIGEGEITFRELCDFYYEKYETSENEASESTTNRLFNIKGLAINSNYARKISSDAIKETTSDRDVIFTEHRESANLSSLNFAYDTTSDFSNRIIYYESSRGCPFSCSYCLSSVDKALRFRDLSLVKNELLFFINQKVPQIKFVDRTFNCNHEHAIAIWQFIKENDNGVTNFHFEISADLINENELAMISDMRPGLIQLEIGVQSTNEVTIKEIHRTMKLDRLKNIVSRIKSFGNIHQHLDLIAGLPYEGYDSFRKSFDEIFALWPNQLQLGFLKVLKGSFMYEHAKDYGIVYHDNPPYEVMSTRWLSYDEVLKIKRVEEMVEVYYNSGQYEITMKLIECISDSIFDFFQAFGDFYEERGYLHISHSRIRRCEILLEFLESAVYMDNNFGVKGTSDIDCNFEINSSFDIELFKEALIFDLYFRENCKTRPSWAVDQGTFKEQTKTFCKKGKLSHLEQFNYVFPDKNATGISVLPTREPNPVWMLFDYEDRDPLDNQARVVRVG